MSEGEQTVACYCRNTRGRRGQCRWVLGWEIFLEKARMQEEPGLGAAQRPGAGGQKSVVSPASTGQEG